MTEAASSDTPYRYITVSDIRCFNLPGRSHRYFVSISGGLGASRVAEASRVRSPLWTEQFPCIVPHNSSITLTIFRRRLLTGKVVIGSANIDVESRLNGEVDQDTPVQLLPPDNADGSVAAVSRASIRCRIIEQARAQTVSDAVSHAQNDVQAMTAAPALIAGIFDDHGHADQVASTFQEAVNTWAPVIESIKQFATLVEGISKIHPYAHAAWKVFSIVPAVINNQLKTDRQLRDLVASMKYACDFVCQATPLEEIETHAEFFAKMACVTLECGYLIREYVRTDKFATRAGKNISGAARRKLAEQLQSLRALMDEFKDTAVIQTEITVMRTLEVAGSVSESVDKLASSNYLDDMMYAKGAGCVPEKRCLEGTRRALLASIIDRLHGVHDHEGSKRIILLTGVAGSGKSAVAHEIAHYFKSLPKRLGSSFCFSASNQAERSVDRFFSTISRNLAELDNEWRDALVDVIKSDKEKRTTRSPQEQLNEFILKPARKLQFVGPVVIVVDALDEVADEERKSLLDCLTRLATDTTLPDNVRFFITSRPEPTILNALYGKAHIQHMDILSADATDDIRRFIEHELLATHLDAEEETILYEWVPYLTEQAENSFQWAYTSCEFIRNDIPGLSVDERFLMLKTQRFRGLESLYEAIMNKVVTIGNVLKEHAFEAELQEKLRRVLALIVTAYQPLPWSAWIDLLGADSEDVRTAGSILPYLGPLFRGVSVADRDSNRPIQPAHTSLRDHLIRGSRNKRFRIDTVTAHVQLVNACLRTMDAQLKFNICGLESSYRANKNVPDLAGRIQENISPALLYACRFWNSHLTAAPHKQCPLDALSSFLEEKLLFWLEVMALVGIVVSASIGIKEVRKWIQTSNSDMDEQLHQLDKMLSDIEQFASMCMPAISLSTPHLYVSALAYVPQTSFIHRSYSDAYAGGVRVVNKEDLQWLRCILRIATSSDIFSVAISPDGGILATAHHDGTVMLWNAVTGERVGKPFIGHAALAWSVAYSPDGKTIASASLDKTVRLWDIATGEQIGSHSRGYAGWVRSVAFSPDGQTVASGSDDKNVRLWKVSDAESVGEVFSGHTDRVMSVAFSPCGTTFASGSRDKTVRIWNAKTKELMYAPLEGHTDGVDAVAFSPDGQTVASGAFDSTIRLWDVATGRPKCSPCVGHTGGVTCVVFSPDGRTLASSSSDWTIRLWMADTGQPIGDPLRGHSGPIRSIAFSSDQHTLVSAAADETIRVWKIEAGPVEPSFATGHSDYVNAVAFSPDGETAASASKDGTVRLWNVRTGEPAGLLRRGYTDEVTSVVFSPDGGTIAAGLRDRTIRLWSTQTGRLRCKPLVGHSDWVRAVAFSPDGRFIASGSDDKTIRLWNALTGKQLGHPLTGHADYVRSVAFSSDGRHLASGSDDRTVMLWDVVTRQRITEPLFGHDHFVLSVAFSPDGHTIASGSRDATIRLWRTNTQEPIGEPLEAHAEGVTSVAFSLDGKTLVSGSRDHTIRLWDVTTRAPIAGPIRGHTHEVTSVSFSPDGVSILSGSFDHTVRLWTIRNNEPGDSIEPQLLAYTDSSELVSSSGYIVGPSHELLFWVPPDYQIGLFRPGTRWVAGARSLRLDLSCFVHGEHWTQCRNASVVS
ncbi:WD40 repeat-like protein [Trametopsis cervina]|nr:WD40 repeat-like protein [Trametopsis cervina]